MNSHLLVLKRICLFRLINQEVIMSVTHVLYWCGQHLEDGTTNLATGTEDQMEALKEKLEAELPDRTPRACLKTMKVPVNPDPETVMEGNVSCFEEISGRGL